MDAWGLWLNSERDGLSVDKWSDVWVADDATDSFSKILKTIKSYYQYHIISQNIYLVIFFHPFFSDIFLINAKKGSINVVQILIKHEYKIFIEPDLRKVCLIWKCMWASLSFQLSRTYTCIWIYIIIIKYDNISTSLSSAKHSQFLINYCSFFGPRSKLTNHYKTYKLNKCNMKKFFVDERKNLGMHVFNWFGLISQLG